MSPVWINLVVEDSLSEAILRRLLREAGRRYEVAAVFGHRGNAYIRQRLPSFNLAARHRPYLILTDLDCESCAPALLLSWLPQHRHRQLLFRVAVRETEAWLLADRETLAKYLQISTALLPAAVEDIANPKQFLVQLAGRSRSRAIRAGMVPPVGGKSEVGPDFNGMLAQFVQNHWNAKEAAKRADSLGRALRNLSEFHSTIKP